MNTSFRRRVFTPSKLIAAWVLGLAVSAGAQQKVAVPSLDGQGGARIQLVGYWFAAQAEGPRPAVALFHGCSGPYNAKGELDRRMREYAQLLNAEKWHVLVVDSLSPRGEKQLCTQKIGTRVVTQVNRRRDALGALQWLAGRPEVDAKRLALLGWSNGGSTALASTNALRQEVKASDVKPRAAVAFYPGCEADLKHGYQAQTSLLLLLGDSDDWTPPQPCVELAKRAGGAVQVQTYDGAHHGFDSVSPVRLRKDVPNGVRPGQGVHVGGNPAAREASQRRMLDFLRAQLKD